MDEINCHALGGELPNTCFPGGRGISTTLRLQQSHEADGRMGLTSMLSVRFSYLVYKSADFLSAYLALTGHT